MRVKIYSNEHNAWWKANYFGYTNDESKAGVFEIEEVNKIYPYIDFDTTKEDYLVKFECLTYEELQKENQELKKFIEIIKKHFIIKLEEETDLNGNVWGRLVSIQSKEDEGTWDTTAYANIVNCKEDFDLLEEVLEE